MDRVNETRPLIELLLLAAKALDASADAEKEEESDEERGREE